MACGNKVQDSVAKLSNEFQNYSNFYIFQEDDLS